ncbi:MAG: hypothetical protein ACYS67_04250 [Planctomycetota bacterium]|jgi:hypothetical protein
MMEKTKQDICDLSEFDETVSLWQLIPSGKGKALTLLRTIVDSIHNSDNPKLPSILIVGDEAKRTHANGFFRALGVKQINEIHASLLLPGSGLIQFFSSEYNVAHLIAYVELLLPTPNLPGVQCTLVHQSMNGFGWAKIQTCEEYYLQNGDANTQRACDVLDELAGGGE